MLTIIVPGIDLFDEITEEFIVTETTTLHLEHSLVSLSKWESIFEKPFLSDNDMTHEEILKYIECMIVDDNFPPEVFAHLSEENFEQINSYVDAKMTATWFHETRPTRNSEAITSELIYYWLTVFRIPFEVEHWHLNRLFTLLKICNVKQSKPKPMSRAEIAARNSQLNAERKAKLGTTG